MANYHSEGYLARALRWIRIWSDEPAYADAKYTDTDLSLLLSSAMEKVLLDVHGQAAGPPLAYFTITLVPGQEEYQLPANMGELLRIGHRNDTTGLVDWEIVPGSRRAPAGPGFVLNGTTSIRFVPLPYRDADVTLEFIPNGSIRMHQNAVPYRESGSVLFGTDLTSFRFSAKNTSWFLGTLDRRPNAFLGCTVRVLGTTHDGAPNDVPFFPIVERTVETYDLYDNMAVTFNQPVDSGPTWSSVSDNDTLGNPGDPQTYVVYEVLPDADPALLWLAAMDAAIDIVGIKKDNDKKASLLLLRERGMRALQLRWANANMRSGSNYDTAGVDSTGQWNPWEM